MISGQRDWKSWSHPAQWAPEGDWATWLFLGGRGAGKTRAGAEWLTLQAQAGRRLALVGPTLHDVREVMIEGPSGLRAIVPQGRRPTYHSSRRILSWPGGAEAHVFSAEDAESLRGPQFHAAWADELCAWREPDAVLAMLRLGLRLGDRPRLAVTTSPKPIKALRALMAEPTSVVTRAGTVENRKHLSVGFLDGLTALYGGTRLEAQEVHGQILDADGGLWTLETLQAARGDRPERFDRIVIGLDPPVTSHGDACGIVIAGRWDGMVYVLADQSVRGVSPLGWARRVSALALEYRVDAVIAESNQGGEMVTELLKVAECRAELRPVHATQSKRARAEPVAALYEQGRVVHCGDFALLEEEMMALGVVSKGPSPDRADALVWAVSHLLLDRRSGPRISVL